MVLQRPNAADGTAYRRVVPVPRPEQPRHRLSVASSHRALAVTSEAWWSALRVTR